MILLYRLVDFLALIKFVVCEARSLTVQCPCHATSSQWSSLSLWRKHVISSFEIRCRMFLQIVVKVELGSGMTVGLSFCGAVIPAVHSDMEANPYLF